MTPSIVTPSITAPSIGMGEDVWEEGKEARDEDCGVHVHDEKPSV